MKITHLKLGQVGTSIHSKRQVTICAELGGHREFMTITVCVPNSGSEREDREFGIQEQKTSQEASRTCLRSCFLRDNDTKAVQFQDGSFCISCIVSSDLRLIV